MSDHYVRGQWNVICDRCGGQYKSAQLRKEYTGLMVCHGHGTRGCWEPRHPNELETPREDRQEVPWTRPDPAPVYASALTQPQSQDDL